jgi:uncharacterized membrane protein
VTLAASLAWLAAIVLAPVLRSRGHAGAAAFLYSVFAPVCHQIPGRSFFVCGFPLAVCARCLGVYTGALAGLLAYPFVRGFSRLEVPPGRLFLLLSLPIGLDFAGGLLGLWSSPNLLRAATGFAWGVLLPYYFITGAAELLLRRPGAGLANRPEKTVE